MSRAHNAWPGRLVWLVDEDDAMTRLAGPVDPNGGAVARLAQALRDLRDEAGSAAPTIDEISEREGVPRSTLYAALTGRHLPGRKAIAALGRSWGGDERDWLRRRSEAEAARSRETT